MWIFFDFISILHKTPVSVICLLMTAGFRCQEPEYLLCKFAVSLLKFVSIINQYWNYKFCVYLFIFSVNFSLYLLFQATLKYWQIVYLVFGHMQQSIKNIIILYIVAFLLFAKLSSQINNYKQNSKVKERHRWIIVSDGPLRVGLKYKVTWVWMQTVKNKRCLY